MDAERYSGIDFANSKSDSYNATNTDVMSELNAYFKSYIANVGGNEERDIQKTLDGILHESTFDDAIDAIHRDKYDDSDSDQGKHFDDEDIYDNVEQNMLDVEVLDQHIDKHGLTGGSDATRAIENMAGGGLNKDSEELDDDEATIKMVDSNIYRNLILPSEKAFAYRMKMEAMKHQGKASCHNGTKLRSDEKLSEKSNDSARQIQRYIRLTFLIPELLEIVDNTGKIKEKHNLTMGLLPAVELSFLSKHEQQVVYSAITYEDTTPSHAQAIRIRKLSSKKLLTFDALEKILCEEKGNQHEKISFNKEKIESALPKELLKRDKRYIEQYIIETIENFNYLNTIKKSDE